MARKIPATQRRVSLSQIGFPNRSQQPVQLRWHPVAMPHLLQAAAGLSLSVSAGPQGAGVPARQGGLPLR